MASENTYTVEEAAKILNIGQQAVRERMRRGRLPIGIVTRTNRNGEREWSFDIYKNWVQRFLDGNFVTIPKWMSDTVEEE